MPIYEFYCPKCDNVIELMRHYPDFTLPRCLECNVEMKRKVSFPSIVKIDKVPPHLRKKSFGSAPYAHG